MVHYRLLFYFRWKITTTSLNLDNSPHIDSGKWISTSLPFNVMNNYFSLAADAKVALEFHMKREKNPRGFSNQKMNKIKYAQVTFIEV